MKDKEIEDTIFSRVEIEINSDCNRKCWYCPNSVAERKTQGEMAPETYLTLMDQLRKIQYKGEISFEFYNEPMLAKNFTWFVEKARTMLPEAQLELYTNGTLLTYPKFQELLKLGIDKFVVTKHFQEKNYVFDETFAALSESEKEKVSFRGWKELKMSNRGGMLEVGPAKIPALSPCYIPSFLVVVTNRGNVLPCFEDFHEEMVMGNIMEEDLMTIWHSPKYASLRKKLRQSLRHLFGPCKNCNRLEVIPQSKAR